MNTTADAVVMAIPVIASGWRTSTARSGWATENLPQGAAPAFYGPGRGVPGCGRYFNDCM
jgi:hypothetical protein